MSENSGKGDSPVGRVQMDAETMSQGLYFSKTPLPKRARMAKITTTMFGLYPLITDRKTTAGIGGFAAGAQWVRCELNGTPVRRNKAVRTHEGACPCATSRDGL